MELRCWQHKVLRHWLRPGRAAAPVLHPTRAGRRPGGCFSSSPAAFAMARAFDAASLGFGHALLMERRPCFRFGLYDCSGYPLHLARPRGRAACRSWKAGIRSPCHPVFAPPGNNPSPFSRAPDRPKNQPLEFAANELPAVSQSRAVRLGRKEFAPGYEGPSDFAPGSVAFCRFARESLHEADAAYAEFSQSRRAFSTDVSRPPRQWLE